MTEADYAPTKQQQAIIGHEKSAFISACPGAGKTRVMVARAEKLLANKEPGMGVAFLSFTRSAVSELEERLRAANLLPTPSFPHFIGTFDSFIWQFMVSPFGFLELGKPPTLIPDLDAKEIGPNRARPLPLSCFDPVTNRIIEEAAVRKGFNVAEKEDWQIRGYQTAAQTVRERLLANGTIGFDQARSIAQSLLADRDFSMTLGQALANRFREIIVDEAQDCNPGDLEIISWLKDLRIPVKVICDPQQAIYSFRGGVNDHLTKFSERFAQEEQLPLTGNFRSSPNICKSVSRLRPVNAQDIVDEPLGTYKDCAFKVVLFSYAGQSVSNAIGTAFAERVTALQLDAAQCPVLASTRPSGAKAVGLPSVGPTSDRTLRFAGAVTRFHVVDETSDRKHALETAHAALLSIEGRLDGITYDQYLVAEDITADNWRPDVITIIRQLRWDPDSFADAEAWLVRARELIEPRLVADVGTIAQRMRRHNGLTEILSGSISNGVRAQTIHFAKGRQFPAVCVVLVPQTFGSILSFLTDGSSPEYAEDTRKIYVAASRAEQLLTFAVPRSRVAGFESLLAVSGTEVEIIEI